MNPAAWSYAAIAVVLLAWCPQLALVVGGLIILSARLQSKHVSFFTRGSGRTSPLVMILRMFGLSVGGMCVIAMVLVAGGVLSTPLTSLWLILMAPVSIFCLFMWVTQNAITEVIFRGRNDTYDHFRATGGDAFCDQLPWPFNTDSEVVRQGGLPEPEYTNLHFVPDSTWTFQCPNCGARLEHMHYACWHCGYNWGNSPWEYECGACGVRVPEGHHGCWNCGNRGSPGPSDADNPFVI